MIAAQDDYFFVDNLQAERLVEPRRISLPCYVLERFIETADDPNVTVSGADGRVAIGEEIKSRDEEQCLERIVARRVDTVDYVGGIVNRRSDGASRRQRLAPTARPRLTQGGELRQRGRLNICERRRRCILCFDSVSNSSVV